MVVKCVATNHLYCRAQFCECLRFIKMRRCLFGSSTTHLFVLRLVACGCPSLGFKRPQGYKDLNHPPFMVLGTLWVRQSLVPSSNSTSNSTVWVWIDDVERVLLQAEACRQSIARILVCNAGKFFRPSDLRRIGASLSLLSRFPTDIELQIT